MRKSERLRLLEMQVLRLEFQLDLIQTYYESLFDSLSINKPELDAGKWYQKKLDNNS
jgi:hypothetical protein